MLVARHASVYTVKAFRKQGLCLVAHLSARCERGRSAVGGAPVVAISASLPPREGATAPYNVHTNTCPVSIDRSEETGRDRWLILSPQASPEFPISGYENLSSPDTIGLPRKADETTEGRQSILRHEGNGVGMAENIHPRQATIDPALFVVAGKLRFWKLFLDMCPPEYQFLLSNIQQSSEKATDHG
ncbi:hypothetical protein EVAR_36979_1 [Eumeta japonica]|uniref:Uncharacterized protein n=1 Tax=Eumeta variegata TaxID=151549 RepID=A0A4C1WAJ0_EUMVA|nr:hypothetical protein EVAR_36979_1 [Eumeta japonica]